MINNLWNYFCFRYVVLLPCPSGLVIPDLPLFLFIPWLFIFWTTAFPFCVWNFPSSLPLWRFHIPSVTPFPSVSLCRGSLPEQMFPCPVDIVIHMFPCFFCGDLSSCPPPFCCSHHPLRASKPQSYHRLCFLGFLWPEFRPSEFSFFSQTSYPFKGAAPGSG